MLRRIAINIGFLTLMVAMPLAADAPTEEQRAFFEAKIKPVLEKHCYKCHSASAAEANKLKGGLLLDTRDGWTKGGESGVVIEPGKPQSSLLISALRYQDLEMPPSGKLP